jgi:hypothetical protein
MNQKVHFEVFLQNCPLYWPLLLEQLNTPTYLQCNFGGHGIMPHAADGKLDNDNSKSSHGDQQYSCQQRSTPKRRSRTAAVATAVAAALPQHCQSIKNKPSNKLDWVIIAILVYQQTH